MAIGVPEMLGFNVTDAGHLFTFSERKGAVLINNKGDAQVACQLGAVPANANPGDGKVTLVSGRGYYFDSGNILSIGVRAAPLQVAGIDVIGLAEAKVAGLAKRRGITLTRLRMIYGSDSYNLYTPAGVVFNIPPFGPQSSGLQGLGGADIDTDNYWGCHMACQFNANGNVPALGGALNVGARLTFYDGGGLVVGAFMNLPTFATLNAAGVADGQVSNSDCLFVVAPLSGVITNWQVDIVGGGATGFEVGNYGVTPVFTWFKR